MPEEREAEVMQLRAARSRGTRAQGVAAAETQSSCSQEVHGDSVSILHLMLESWKSPPVSLGGQSKFPVRCQLRGKLLSKRMKV